jgi:hypothetical protein
MGPRAVTGKTYRKHTYRLPRFVTGTALLFIGRWCSYLTGNARLLVCYEDSFILLYGDDVRTSQETQGLLNLLRE